MKKEDRVCEECGSLFLQSSSPMKALCPECAHHLYGFPNCQHQFQNGRCIHCHWDGRKSEFLKRWRIGQI